MTQRTAASCSRSVTTAIATVGPTTSDESTRVAIIGLEGELDLSNVVLTGVSHTFATFASRKEAFAYFAGGDA